MNAEDRLIIALDLPTVDAAQTTVDAIGPSGVFYKIGYQLMPIGGLQLAEQLTAEGKKPSSISSSTTSAQRWSEASQASQNLAAIS